MCLLATWYPKEQPGSIGVHEGGISWFLYLRNRCPVDCKWDEVTIPPSKRMCTIVDCRVRTWIYLRIGDWPKNLRIKFWYSDTVVFDKAIGCKVLTGSCVLAPDIFPYDLRQCLNFDTGPLDHREALEVFTKAVSASALKQPWFQRGRYCCGVKSQGSHCLVEMSAWSYIRYGVSLALPAWGSHKNRTF